MKQDVVLLGHGSGGKLSAELIDQIFLKAFGQPDAFLTDASLIEFNGQKLAITTDTYVVDPIFFPGGNIGKLAVCGTVNDLAVSGARPLYLTSGFIIEEGFSIAQLREIVSTMATEAQLAGVRIIAGDTKVVPKGKCDKIFINTSGFGIVDEDRSHIAGGLHCEPGDLIILNGYLGDHSTAIMASRNNFEFNPVLVSDCASLHSLIESIMQHRSSISFMRDVTRGGLATVLCELAAGRNLTIRLIEDHIPVREQVAGFCEMFGFDPLYMANEGKVVMVVKSKAAHQILETLKNHPLGLNSAIIGEVVKAGRAQVTLHTTTGGKRLVDMLSGEQLPRIC